MSVFLQQCHSSCGRSADTLLSVMQQRENMPFIVPKAFVTQTGVVHRPVTICQDETPANVFLTDTSMF